MILAPTLVGFGIAMVRGGYDFRVAKNFRTFLVAVVWTCYVLSYSFGPYVGADGPYRFTDPTWAITTFNKMFLLFFVAIVCINSERNLKAMTYVLMFSGAYLIYWANARYLSGGVYGRMAGPVSMFGDGIYRDENNFAMLFVVVLPFLWNMGFTIKNRWLRWGMWLIIPFGWHAVFLTGSRGGLVGIGATLALTVVRSKKKFLSLLLVPAFAFAFVWQAGDTMRNRASTISEYETENSAASRLQAWQAAIGMIKSHPLLGVGLASFGPAFPDYSDKHPREAHNTFFQISAESGLIAGLSYIATIVLSLLGVWRVGSRYRKTRDPTADDVLYWINESLLVGFSGFLVCSMFLSLQMFEIYFFLVVACNACIYLSKQVLEGEPATIPPARTGRPGVTNWRRNFPAAMATEDDHDSG